MEWEGKEFAEGVWFAIEQLITWHYDYDKARSIIGESNLDEWEFRQILKETGYEVKKLTKFLDSVFEKESA